MANEITIKLTVKELKLIMEMLAIHEILPKHKRSALSEPYVELLNKLENI